MPKQIIREDGEETLVREDTAKAFRWNKFIGIILAGIVVILILGILFFSGIFTTVQPNLSAPSNSANENARNPGP